MIKNILYSLFLHSLLLFLIYFNFRHIINEKLDLKEGITVGIIGLQDISKPQKLITKPEVAVEKSEKKIVKKISKPKPKIVKNKIDETKAIKPVEEKKPEFKKIEETKIVEKEKKVEEKKIIETKEELEEEPLEDIEETNLEEANTTENLENLQLSAREKFNIQSQLRACYKRALRNVPKSNFVAIVTVSVSQDGTINFDQDEMIDFKRYHNAKEVDYKHRMDAVLQTLELCSPLRNMPLDKYDVWREFTIEFGVE
jgi:hypothetical protein